LLFVDLVTMASVISWSGGSLRYQGPGVKMALGVLEFLLLWGGISSLYRFVPNTYVAWRPLIWGSFFTALVLEAARSGLTFYLASMPTFSLIYGTFATVPILLVWIYTTWVVVLLGAVLVASWPALVNESLDGFVDQAGRGFALALGCLRLLQQARLKSEGGGNVPRLAQQLGAQPWEVDEVLALLQQLDWVGVLSEPTTPRYVLLIDLATTRAAPLMNQLLLDDNAQTQAVWSRWQDWRLAELV
jgi:membrane protein